MTSPQTTTNCMRACARHLKIALFLFLSLILTLPSLQLAAYALHCPAPLVCSVRVCMYVCVNQVPVKQTYSLSYLSLSGHNTCLVLPIPNFLSPYMRRMMLSQALLPSKRSDQPLKTVIVQTETGL